MRSSPAVVDGVVYVGSWDGKLYAVEAGSGEERWSFTTGGGVRSSPAVVDGVVYVGSRDGTFYAVEAGSGEERWSFTTGGEVRSSPAVVDGVVYVGSGDGSLYAIGEASAEVQTATAEAHAIATANVAATRTAEANATATAIANELAWESYFDTIGVTMAESPELPPGLEVDVEWFMGDLAVLPGGWIRGATYPVEVIGSLDVPAVSLLFFASREEADAGYAALTGGLVRSGWQEQEVEGLDHTHSCLVLVRDGESQGVCYMTRDDALIVSYSLISADAPDAALLNATDLARLANDAYDDVDRPDE